MGTLYDARSGTPYSTFQTSPFHLRKSKPSAKPVNAKPSTILQLFFHSVFFSSNKNDMLTTFPNSANIYSFIQSNERNDCWTNGNFVYILLTFVYFLLTFVYFLLTFLCVFPFICLLFPHICSLFAYICLLKVNFGLPFVNFCLHFVLSLISYEAVFTILENGLIATFRF